MQYIIINNFLNYKQMFAYSILPTIETTRKYARIIVNTHTQVNIFWDQIYFKTLRRNSTNEN